MSLDQNGEEIAVGDMVTWMTRTTEEKVYGIVIATNETHSQVQIPSFGVTGGVLNSRLAVVTEEMGS